VCGDNLVNPARGETCDENVNGDGQADNTPTCDFDCTAPVCGDSFVNPAASEQCDAGGANSNAPDASCRPDCQPRRCGDGILDPRAGEACDGAVGCSGEQICDSFCQACS
jgi:hypothetical protein